MAGEDREARRGKGRRKGAAVGRDDILAATTRLLRTTPLEKMTSAAVARLVGVTPQLINYYFKSRAELLVATALELLRTEGERSGFGEMPSDLPAEEALRVRLRALIRRHRTYPYFSRLIIDQVLNSDSPEAKAGFATLVATTREAYASLIERGVAEGVMRPVRPEFLYVSTIGMCDFFASGRHIVEVASERIETESERTDAYIDFAVDMILEGLRPR